MVFKLYPVIYSFTFYHHQFESQTLGSQITYQFTHPLRQIFEDRVRLSCFTCKNQFYLSCELITAKNLVNPFKMRKQKLIAASLIATTLILISQSILHAQDQSYLTEVEDLKSKMCHDISALSSSEMTAAVYIRHTLLNSNALLGIQEIIEKAANNEDLTNQDTEKLAKGLVDVMMPWLVLFVLTIFILIGQVFCCCECCPPCDECRMTKATNYSEIQNVVCYTTVITLIVIAFCIAGLALAGGTTELIKSIHCSVFTVMDEIKDGADEKSSGNINKWKGLTGIEAHIDKIDADLDSFIAQTQQLADQIDAEELKKQYSDLRAENRKLAPSFTSPNSYFVNANLLKYLQDNSAQISDNYVQARTSKLLPQDQIFKVIYENIIDQIGSIKDSANDLTEDQEDIKDSLQKAKDELTKFRQSLTKVANKYYSETRDDFENGSYPINLVFITIFGLVLIFSILAIMSLHYIPIANNSSIWMILFKCSYFCYQIFILISFFICILLVCFLQASGESCEYLDKMQNDEKFAQQSRLFRDSDKELYRTCFFGDGSISDRLNISDTINSVNKLDDSVEDFNRAKDTYNKELAKGDAQLSINRAFVDGLGSFRYVDYRQPKSDTDKSNIKTVMRVSFRNCRNKDSVVDDQTLCYPDQTFYDPSGLQPFPTRNQPFCFQSETFTKHRDSLSGRFSGCSKFSQGLRFSSTQSQKWKATGEQQSKIINIHSQNAAFLGQKMERLSSYTEKVQTYLNRVVNNQTGLVSILNCNFIKPSFTKITSQVCGRMFRYLFIMYVSLALNGGVMLLGTLLMARIHTSLINIDKHSINIENQPMIEMNAVLENPVDDQQQLPPQSLYPQFQAINQPENSQQYQQQQLQQPNLQQDPQQQQQQVLKQIFSKNIDEIKSVVATFKPQAIIVDEQQEKFRDLFGNKNQSIQHNLEQQLLKACYQQTNQATIQEKKTRVQSKYLHNKYLAKKFVQQIEKEDVVCPLIKGVPQNISVENIELLFYVMADQFRQAGASFYKSKVSEESNIYQFSSLCAKECQDAVVNEIKFDNTNEVNFEKLKQNRQTEQQFRDALIENLARAYNVSKEEINIISIEPGSIKVVYQITKNDNSILEDSTKSKQILQKIYPGAKVELKIKRLFQQCAWLSANDFEEGHNMTWENFKIGDACERGPRGNRMKYFYPIGYKGYALKVSNKYDSGNCDWLGMNGNPNEWYILYHGTSCSPDVIGNIIAEGLKAGGNNAYAQQTCIRTQKIIGVGTYFSNHVEVSEGYSQSRSRGTTVGDKQYYVVFQARVRPSAVRQPKKQGSLRGQSQFASFFAIDTNLPETQKLWDNDYFVVNNSEDIRPYRVLLKEQKF